MSAPTPAPVRAAPTMQPPARPQLLFFYASTSGSSRRAEGFLAQVLQRRRNHESFHVRPIDVGRHKKLAERFRIDAVPSIVVVEDNCVRARLSRPRGCAEISEALRPWLA
jgi:hypothetical protein